MQRRLVIVESCGGKQLEYLAALKPFQDIEVLCTHDTPEAQTVICPDDIVIVQGQSWDGKSVPSGIDNTLTFLCWLKEQSHTGRVVVATDIYADDPRFAQAYPEITVVSKTALLQNPAMHLCP